MSSKPLFILALCIIAITSVTGTSSADNGPAELILESTIDLGRKPKPAFLPHAVHQKNFQCGICHHSQGDDDKKVAYTKGMEIYRCESCHNRGIDSIQQELNTFKKVAHQLCKGCHTEQKEAGENTGPTECKGCHRKNLQ